MSSGGGRSQRERVDKDGEMEITVNEDVEVLPTFDNMGLREDLLRGIYAYGKCGKLYQQR
jgi:ATP-dependent RNA helicase